jgi:hypothetical protein
MKHKHLPSSITTEFEALAFETDGFYFPPWLHLVARLFGASLDPKLAAGLNPASNHLLAVRAQQLMVAQYRRGVANTWLHLLIEARRPRDPFDLSIPIARDGVLEAESQIRALADALVAPLPTVRGVAMSIEILRNGAGPIFNRTSSVNLTDVVEATIASLDPLGSH